MRRLDQELVDRGLCPSREKARRAIMAGEVRVGGRKASKPAEAVRPGEEIQVAQPEKYVSRGGFKLEHAVRHFGLEVAGVVAVDLGASTGGFADCLLQAGAGRVYAVDVGRGQLAWKLRNDPRVVVMEKTNARYLTREAFPAPFAGAGLVVIDCSFISLRKILPAAIAIAGPSARIVALIKPQFEAGRAEAARGRGVIRDPAVHERVLRELRGFVEGLTGWRWQGAVESPLLGPAGNKEFLALIEKTGGQD